MKLYFILISLLTAICLNAQTTTGKVKWKSASNINYTYTGELKNGKPHGRGLAVSEGGGDIIVYGEFKNGMIDGSTVVRHSTGKIVAVNWKENKPEGTGVVISPDEDIDYGNFVNGILEGKVISIHSDNKIVIRNAKNGKTNGRAVVINPDGTIITDRIYINDTANGPGYQYEVKDKQLFEGIWENGEWVKATTGNYPSFFRSNNLGCEASEDIIAVYSATIETEGKVGLQDTCFYYDLKNNYRRFGYFDHGKLRNGVFLSGDSIRIIGQWNDNGKQGTCAMYKKGQYLNVGNFEDDKLNGAGILIDINDSSIYDGYLSAGNYTGNASWLNKKKESQTGYFEDGKLKGEGKTVFPDGRYLTGSYNNGLLVNIKEVVMPNGQKLDTHPKDVSTAINFLLKQYSNDFTTINSGMPLNDRDNNFNPRFNKVMISSYSFPGALKSLLGVVTNDDNVQQHHEFYTGIAIYKDLESVKKPYDDLCNQLKNCNITSLQKGKILKLVPRIKPLFQENFESGALVSFFTVPLYDAKKTRLVIEVWVQMNYKDGYELVLAIAKADNQK